MSTWKITETGSGELAVIGPYDDAFVADLKALPAASRRWDSGLRAWLVSKAQRRATELIIAKHSPSPLVEVRSGIEGAQQILDLAHRLGEEDSSADDTVRDGLELVLDGEERFVDFSTIRTATVRVDGLLVHVFVVETHDD
ncbi:MAG: hypothetical protein KDC38_17980 [Planctomycetes bacterium]|nr:hypothetical protein [Planctomycetota bacterium]